MRRSNTPLIIAGGGGGIEAAISRHAGCDASTSTTGNPGYKSWSGGSNGYGAQTADSSDSGEKRYCDSGEYYIRACCSYCTGAKLMQKSFVDIEVDILTLLVIRLYIIIINKQQ